MTFRPSYEGKACDAVLKCLEGRLATTRANICYPERTGDTAPIELACDLGGRTYAFEHTAIEPFTGQIQNDNLFERQFAPITARLNPSVPDNEQWELTIAANAMEGMTGAEVRELHDTLVAFIEDAAPTVEVVPWGPINWGRSFELRDGAPLKFRLRRWEMGDSYSGELRGAHITRSVPELDGPRAERLRRTCASKFPKLQAWSERGARTVLVLESDDSILTNPASVAEAYLIAEQDFTYRPDEVYFVWVLNGMTSWYLSAMRVDDRDYKALSRDGTNHIEIDPQALTDITGGETR